MIVDTEISARLRGGVIWAQADALAVGVLARPASMPVLAQDVAWAAASLACAEALEQCLGAQHRCGWPDQVHATSPPTPPTSPNAANLPTRQTYEAITSSPAKAKEAPGGSSGPIPGPALQEPPLAVGITAACSLGPGKVEYAVLVGRIAPVAEAQLRRRLAEAMLECLRAAATGLEDPEALMARYRDKCDTLGCEVEAKLLPHGTVRGTAHDLDNQGRLLVMSPTGMTQTLAVAATNTVTTLPDAHLRESGLPNPGGQP